jgi:hypothetical protein
MIKKRENVDEIVGEISVFRVVQPQIPFEYFLVLIVSHHGDRVSSPLDHFFCISDEDVKFHSVSYLANRTGMSEVATTFFRIVNIEEAQFGMVWEKEEEMSRQFWISAMSLTLCGSGWIRNDSHDWILIVHQTIFQCVEMIAIPV